MSYLSDRKGRTPRSWRIYDFCSSVREFARQLFSLLPSGSPQLPSLDGHSCLRLTLLTVVRVVDLRQLVVAYVGRISLKREPQVNKPAVRALNYCLYKNFRHSTHTGIRTAELSVLLSLKVPHRCTRHCNKGCVQLRVMPSPRRRCVLQKRGRLQACRQERMCGDLDRAKPSSSARIQIPQPSGFCPRGATSRRMPVQTHR